MLVRFPGDWMHLSGNLSLVLLKLFVYQELENFSDPLILRNSLETNKKERKSLEDKLEIPIIEKNLE